MTGKNSYADLTRLTQIILDRSLAELRSAAACRDETLRLLGELDKGADTPLVGTTMAALQAGEVHQFWAARMRADLVLRLGQQNAIWQERRIEASRALGRHQALQELMQVGG